MGLGGSILVWNLEEPCPSLAGDDATGTNRKRAAGVREGALRTVVSMCLEMRSGARLAGPMAVVRSWDFIA